MKMLYVNNYASWTLVSIEKLGSHHLHGIHEMIIKYEYTKKGKLRGLLNDGHVDFHLSRFPYSVSRKYRIFYCFHYIFSAVLICLKSFKYDIIYDVSNSCTRMLAILRRFNLLKPKLITVLHHSPNSIEVKDGQADAYVFFAKKLLTFAAQLYPKVAERFFLNEWQPDTRYYSLKTAELKECIYNYDFIDNGKTYRDRDTVIAAIEKVDARILMSSKHNEKNTNKISYYRHGIDDLEIIRNILSSKVVLIPLGAETPKENTYGISSFVDAVALGKPVVASDNFIFAEDIDRNGNGLVYKAGDKESLCNIMKTMLEDTVYNKCLLRMKIYASKRNMVSYSNILNDIIANLIKNADTSKKTIKSNSDILSDSGSLYRIRKGLLESIFHYDHEIYFYLTSVKNATERSNITDLSTYLRKDKARIHGYLDLVAPDEEHYANMERHEKKPKMAMFTPLPPLMNGIADYIVDLLPELSQHFDIDIYVDDNYTPCSDIATQFKVQNHSGFPTLCEKYDLIVYQVGNNPNHVYMVDYILNYPGIIELHDYRVDYLYRLLPPDVQEYAKANSISDVYPNHEYFGYATNENPVNKYLIEKSLGVIIHNDYAKMGLLKQNWYIPYKVINLSVNAPIKTESKEDLLKKFGIEKNELILATFGRVTSYKHIDVILKAISNLRQKHDRKIRFIIVGNIDPDMVETINRFLSDLNLKDSVTITGHVELDTFYDYIQISDICINLRSFYNGESSGAVARIMSCAKPCLVSNIGSFSELPPDTCVQVTTDEDLLESELIYKLDELIQNRKLRDKIGSSAFNYAMNELNVKKLAVEMRDFLILSINSDIHKKRVTIDNLAKFMCYNKFTDIDWVFDYACKYLAKKWEKDFG